MSDASDNTGWILAREMILAFGMIGMLILGMWIHTGSMPPLVVVESDSMIHSEKGEIGSIDAGDLILVHSYPPEDIVTYAEATDPSGFHFGHDSLGMGGDVIIYKKNGLDSYTPVIHRALLKVTVNSSGGWDVPGTTLRGVDNITWSLLGYECTYHNGVYNLTIYGWEPSTEGYLTAGDNNDCMVDQPSVNQPTQGSGFFVDGEPVQAVRDEWISGIASTEIPWLGAAKLVISGTSDQVTYTTWRSLMLAVAVIISVPYLLEFVMGRREQSDEEE